MQRTTGKQEPYDLPLVFVHLKRLGYQTRTFKLNSFQLPFPFFPTFPRERAQQDAAWLEEWVPKHKNIPEQWEILQHIQTSIDEGVPTHIFIDGPAGTGKRIR